MKLLARMYAPTSGRITVDDHDLVSFDGAAWRRAIAASFQDVVQLQFSAREAIGVGDLPRISDRVAIHAAVRRASAQDVVATLPHDLDTQLGRQFGGAELSGGQWQKIALSRGMMRQAPLLLVLDEPAPALDAETEHALL